MWRRERAQDPMAEYLAARAASETSQPAPVDPSQEARFTAGLPAARPTTAGERNETVARQRSGNRRLVRRILIHGTWITLGIVGTVVISHRDSHDAPKVGECGRYTAGHKLEKVDCGDDDAAYVVTSRVDDVTGAAACGDDVKATSYYSYDGGTVGESFVLCLADNEASGTP